MLLLRLLQLHNACQKRRRAGRRVARTGFAGARAARETVQTLYIGGGTPTICTPRELEGLIRTVRDTFDTQIEEITVEANPDDLTPGYLEALRGTGTNRLSIGVQSLLDRDLRWMNRRHDARQALRAVRDAQAAGFANLSLDLIYGLPQLSVEQWRRTLDDFLSLDVPHLSAYHLSVEPRTALGKRFERGAFHPAGERLSEAHYALLHAVLTGAGYRHYEISSFARPGFESRHNSSYWKGVRYLGVGPAAIRSTATDGAGTFPTCGNICARNPRERSTKPRRSPRRTHTTSSL